MTETKQTLVVRIGLMGMADEGIGTASFVLSTGMSEEAMKSALENAMGVATREAVTGVAGSFALILGEALA